MIKDNPRGVAYLLGEPGPVDPVVQRYKDKMKELKEKPLSDHIDVFSSLPFATTEVNLGVSNPGAIPKVKSPEPRDDYGNTRAQKQKMINDQLTRKPFDWSIVTKPAAKIMNDEADVTSPSDAKQKQKPYWINYNGELVDANNAKHWQSVTKMAEEEKPKKPVHQQLLDLKNWDQENKQRFYDRNKKTIQKDIANNKQGGKI